MVAKQIGSSTCRDRSHERKPSIRNYLCIEEMLSRGIAQGGSISRTQALTSIKRGIDYCSTTAWLAQSREADCEFRRWVMVELRKMRPWLLELN